MRPGDVITESSFDEVTDIAIDPQHFSLADNSGFHRTKKIDWIWGYSFHEKYLFWFRQILSFVLI